MKLSDIKDEKERRITAGLLYGEEYERAISAGHSPEDVITQLVKMHFNDEIPLESYDFVKEGGKIDCTLLAKHFKKKEHYVFVAGKHESSKAIRYLYDKERGVYDDVSDIALQSKIKDYIEKAAPDKARARDIQESFYLITRDNCFISADDMNADENIINFKNGILNIDTEEFTEHSPDVLSSIQINANYHAGKVYTLADAPVFKSYIETLTAGSEAENKKAILLEYLGACISNVAGSRFKKCLFLYGEHGDSGKSQYLELINRILGTGNTQAVDFSSLSDRFTAASYYDKRFIFTGDAVFDSKKSNKRFMEITGGDPIRVEQKGMTEFTAHCKGMMLFSSNYLPTWSGNTTNAAYNRILIVVCDNTIPVEKRDTHLIDKMMKERDVIVYLALQALKAAIKRGYRFTHTNEAEKALAKLKRNNQQGVAFFTECCTMQGNSRKGHRQKQTAIHDAYRQWFAENYPDSKCIIRGFSAEIARYLGVSEEDILTKYNGYWYYTFELTQDAKERYKMFDVV